MTPPVKQQFEFLNDWYRKKMEFKRWVFQTHGLAGKRAYFNWRRTGVWIEPEKESEDMAKQIIHVGVALATDGVMSNRDNVLSIGATIGGGQDFTINVLPSGGKYKSTPYWDKHLDELRLIQKDAVSLATAIDGLDQWLKKWQGRLIACTSNLDFWFLFSAMMEYTGLCPFGSIPMDTNSFYCGANGTKTPGRLTDKVMPLDIAKERWHMVTQGYMPAFGEVKIPKKKIGDTLTWSSPGRSSSRLSTNRWFEVPTPEAFDTLRQRIHASSQQLMYERPRMTIDEEDR